MFNKIFNSSFSKNVFNKISFFKSSFFKISFLIFVFSFFILQPIIVNAVVETITEPEVICSYNKENMETENGVGTLISIDQGTYTGKCFETYLSGCDAHVFSDTSATYICNSQPTQTVAIETICTSTLSYSTNNYFKDISLVKKSNNTFFLRFKANNQIIKGGSFGNTDLDIGVVSTHTLKLFRINSSEITLFLPEFRLNATLNDGLGIVDAFIGLDICSNSDTPTPSNTAPNLYVR